MKKFEKLSERQQKILRFMDRYVNANGYPPTIREIGEATQINSTSVVNYNLNKLVKLGYIQRSSTKSRGLRMVKNLPGGDRSVRTSVSSMSIPLKGRIVAGQPVEQFDTSDEEIEVVPTMLGGVDPSEVYAVRVNGDSMIDAMISDGDIVILRRAENARNGDMVAVWLEDRNETTLKYIFYEEDNVRLQPAHPTMEPIYVPADSVRIQGRILSVLRVVR